MTEKNILDIIKLRFAVYSAGVIMHKWESLEDNGAKEMMEYIFPKSGGLAYYNLVIELMKKKHSEFIPSGEYSLFNLPVQFEEEIFSYLKTSSEEGLFSTPEDPMSYLENLSTIICTPSIDPILIGAIKDSGIESILKISAFHYLGIFKENTNSYPYFE